MTTTDVIVSFSKVSKSYDGDRFAVRCLDLDVRRGEFLSLLGPSGSGKTTSLMMLAGFEQPSAGSIMLDGQLLDSVPPWRRGIGVVFQSYALFPHMTVAQNIAFPLSQRGVRSGERASRVAGMLTLIGLEGFGDRKPVQLSGGQQQRVAVARALVFGPKLVLMDEPLGALDKRLREQLQVELKRIHAEVGCTIVYVTHDQNEALAMSDRIAVFADGKVRQLATPTELYERPADPLVADFVGENNALRGEVVSADGKRCQVRLDGGLVIEACPVAAIDAGAPAVLSLRPERVAVSEHPSAVEGDNRVSVSVTSVAFLGDHFRIELRTDTGLKLVAKAPNAAAGGMPPSGARATASWRAVDCRAFAPISSNPDGLQ